MRNNRWGLIPLALCLALSLGRLLPEKRRRKPATAR